MRRASKNAISGLLVLIGCATAATAQTTEGAAVCTESRRILVGAAPNYTEAARRARIQGSAMVRVTLDDAGRVQDATVEKTLPMGLDVGSRNAARHWEFAPPSPTDPCRTLVLEFQFEIGTKAEAVVPLGIVTPPLLIKVIGVAPDIQVNY